MSKKRRKHKLIRADDVLEFGPFRISRLGRFIRWENRATENQHAAIMERFSEAYPRTCSEIDSLVLQIVDVVSSFDPLPLLHRAYWEYLTHNAGIASEVELKSEAIEARLNLEYLQSIICAVPPKKTTKQQATEEEWASITQNIEALYQKLQAEFFIARTAWSKKNDPNYDQKVEDYAVPSEMHWLAVRGDRYLSHDIPHFRDLLSPHNSIFRELFEISVEDFLQALGKVLHNFTRGPMESMEEFDRFRKATLAALEGYIAADRNESDVAVLMDKVIADNGWGAWRDEVIENAIGLGLFELDTSTGLPTKLLDALSWTPGEDDEFLSEGPYRGWPLRVLPIWKRPFLKVEGKHYCFGIYALTDHLYRIVQRTILQLKPEYREIWNRHQQNVAEQLPLNLLSRVLPGCEIYRSVYYQWNTGDNQQRQWCETDGLLVYDDHLIIIEVKAGAFTHSPPSTDFPAYIRSLENLLRAPALQAVRFCSYLDSSPEVSIYDKEHRLIRQVRRSDYRHITRCCVTLDQITEYAARAEAMADIGINVGGQPVWNISVDDLRVFSDIFRNPLIFCHFLEERAQAYSAKEFETDDELDHLGLYLAHNRYSLHAKDLYTAVGSPVKWHGYREKIDKYYSAHLVSGEDIDPPRQESPQLFNRILDVLANGNLAGRSRAASWLLDMDGAARSQFASRLEEALSEQLVASRPKPVSIFGQIPISVYCWIVGKIQDDRSLVRMHTLATLRRAGEKERLALELFFYPNNRLDDVRFTFLKVSDIHPNEKLALAAYEQRMVERRFERAFTERTKRKIGRNEKCPCGSGRKYKKCCGM